MAVDSALYIGDFDTAKPDGGVDPANELDNNIRQVKAGLVNSFGNVKGAVTVTHTELNTVTNRTLRAGDTYTGAHDFTGATPTVPTATVADSSTKAASTAFVQTAISTVNAQTALTMAIATGTAVTGVVGQHTVCTNAATVTFTLPTMTANQRCRVTFANSLATNIVDPNGQLVFGVSGTRQANLIGTSVEFTYVNSSVGVVY